MIFFIHISSFVIFLVYIYVAYFIDMFEERLFYE